MSELSCAESGLIMRKSLDLSGVYSVAPSMAVPREAEDTFLLAPAVGGAQVPIQVSEGRGVGGSEPGRVEPLGVGSIYKK